MKRKSNKEEPRSNGDEIDKYHVHHWRSAEAAATIHKAAWRGDPEDEKHTVGSTDAVLERFINNANSFGRRRFRLPLASALWSQPIVLRLWLSRYMRAQDLMI